MHKSVLGIRCVITIIAGTWRVDRNRVTPPLPIAQPKQVTTPDKLFSNDMLQTLQKYVVGIDCATNSVVAVPSEPEKILARKIAWGMILLGWHICRTKLVRRFFQGTNFPTKNAPKIFPTFLSLYFVGLKFKETENSRQISLPKIAKKNTDELQQERREKILPEDDLTPTCSSFRELFLINMYAFPKLSARSILHVMWYFPAKIWQTNANIYHITGRPWAFKTSAFGITWCDNSGQNCGSKLQRGFTLGDGCWLPKLSQSIWFICALWSALSAWMCSLLSSLPAAYLATVC